MAVYKRGDVWWYEFVFRGQRIRESSNSSAKTLAIRIERERRRQLELGVAGLKEVRQPLLFSVAMKQWLELNMPRWSKSNLRIESHNCNHLLPVFGKLLLSDVTADDVSRYQAARNREGASARTVNMEVGTLRAILRKHRLWSNIQPDVRMLRTNQDIGRALSDDEEHRLLAASRKSRSRSLAVAVQVSLHTGLRQGELRLLRWRQVDLLEGMLRVGKSKTAGGEGREVPLSDTATRSLSEWRAQFPEAEPAHFVFPSERYGLKGEEGYLTGTTGAYEIRPEVAIGSWKVAWTTARKQARVACRWHDMRHTFISRLAEGQASDATIMALAGHLSRKMMERYSHTRTEWKREAVFMLDRRLSSESPHNFPHTQ
jgi:integrase